MLDLAHQLKLDLQAAADSAKTSIEGIVAVFHDKAVEAVVRFNTETELRLQLLAQGAPAAPEPLPKAALLEQLDKIPDQPLGDL